MREPFMKSRAHGVDGIIVEAAVLPERIGLARHLALAAAQAAERGDVLVTG